ncbi:MAG: 1-acyl-sn-glycerol-3-phosphate acyltransferase [Pseudomonadota bacterium]
MTGSIDVPVWLVVVGGALALIALLDRVIGPGLRWVLRKRFNRAIDDLNTRLQLKIHSFKLTKRQVLIDRLVNDPQVLEAIDEEVTEQSLPREKVLREAETYAREIVPSFSAYAYFKVGARVSRLIAQAFYRVRLGAFDEAALKEIDRDATVVFIMNHRSNFDYLLVTYLAAQASALSYAVGEWARVWPLSRIIRSMGAYFIRRKSRNALYRKVLSRYVHMATEGGVTQAVFPEGGLSRDGTLQPPKLGLLSYIVQGFNTDGPRDVVFVPVGLNYDRVTEDRVLLAARDPDVGSRAFRVSPFTAALFIAQLAWRKLTGRFYKLGYACVSFGSPLSLREFLAGNDEDDPVSALGVELMGRVGQVVPVLPVALISRVLMRADRPLPVFDLKIAAEAELERLHAVGAHSHIPRARLDYAVDVGLRMLTMRHIVEDGPEGLSVVEQERDLLRYYANSIAHLAPETEPA